ncbi:MULTISPECIES: helix-turn-helix transcriptional regulator [Amycolatopsis]|uniref:Helix-turn-helix transcriptional regulator n=1 Tax=Amycolatopsis albidoflavus TaxID=102226 RepID=A0ABW5I6P9_9PSEU
MARSTERVERELAALPRPGLRASELGEALSRAMAPLVAHDALRLLGFSPSTPIGLGSFGFVHGYEPDFGRALYRGLWTGADPCPLSVFQRRPIPGCVAGSDEPRHRATRRMFGSYGVGCELRVVLRTARGMWGTIALLRAEHTQPFTEHDTASVAMLTTALVGVLRRHVVIEPLTPAQPARPAGVLILGADDRIRAATPDGRDWRDQLHQRDAGPDWALDAGLSILAKEARARGDNPRTAAPLFVGPAASYGHWVAAQAQALDGDSTGDVAVVFQQATGDLLLPYFGDWHGLTARERQVVSQLCQGTAAKQIARHLTVSVHTVNEHLKSVYRKTGAEGRDHLVAALNG